MTHDVPKPRGPLPGAGVLIRVSMSELELLLLGGVVIQRRPVLYLAERDGRGGVERRRGQRTGGKSRRRRGVSLERGLEAFLAQLEADGRSRSTRASYERDTRLLQCWMTTTRRTGLEELDHEDLAAFMTSPWALRRADGRGKKATSVNSLRSSMRSFFGYLHAAGILERNPSRLLRRARVGQPVPRALSPNEERRLLDVVAAAQSRAGARDALLVKLMLATGIRIGATLALKLDDIDLDLDEIRVRAKFGHEYRVAAPGHLLGQIADLPRPEGCPWVFATEGGGPIGRRTVTRRFTAWVRQAGLRHATLHALRHTFATRLYDRTHDLLLVQRALGHRSVTSTAIYAQGPREP